MQLKTKLNQWHLISYKIINSDVTKYKKYVKTNVISLGQLLSF